MSLGMTEMTLILVVLILLFGSNKIPELARTLGQASAEYKKAKQAITNEAKELREALLDEDKPKSEPFEPEEG